MVFFRLRKWMSLSTLEKVIPTNVIGDFIYHLTYFIKFHRRLPIRKKYFNDYLFWLKVRRNDAPQLRREISDKYHVKQYVTKKAGMQFCVPTIQLIPSEPEALAYDYPQRCCIKPTHLSGEVILRTQGEPIDFEKITSWFSKNHYRNGREWNYKSLNPALIVEPIIFDNEDVEDLKFFCKNGHVSFIQVDIARHSNHRRLYFDKNWNELSFSLLYDKSEETFPEPKNLIRLIDLASILSKDFDFIRVDLYTDHEIIYVGELTNFPGNGFEKFIPPEGEKVANELFFEGNKDN